MIAENVKVQLRPDTLQSTYQDLESLYLDVEILKFNDGSLKVSLPQMKHEYTHTYCEVKVNVTSMNDIMIVAQVKDIISRFNDTKHFILTIMNTPYTRYDRVMHADKTDAFGAKVFADFVNSIGFDNVNFLDCHSEVMLDLIKQSHSFPQHDLMSFTLQKNGVIVQDFNLIAPDKGATKKLTDPDMVFDKVRNTETGHITGMELVFDDSRADRPYLVVDDICEGGRTFIELAKLFNETKTGSLNLYVTHGIFSNNAIEKLLDFYENIYVYSMPNALYESLKEDDKKRVLTYILN